MKGAAQRWFVAGLLATVWVAAAGVSSAAEVTDADRTYRNFTRETANVAEGDIRVELRGLTEADEGNPHVNLLGFRLKKVFPGKDVEAVNGGIIDVVGSYGVAKNTEIGLIIPSFIENLRLANNAGHLHNEDIGDLELYGKYKYTVAEHCAVGAGLEMSMPNGPEHKGVGTGEFGVTPVVSTRYQHGPFGVGANVGYQIYSGSVPDVFLYGTEIIVRPSELWAFRTELAGRVFNQGVRFNDLTLLPGIDFNLTPNVVIRPTGMVGGTGTALDWGLGLGIAATFSAPSFAMPVAPPPPPAPIAAAPPPVPVKEKIVLRGVHFDYNKANIRDDAKPILDQAAETLKEHGSIRIAVEGHTDSTGREAYNQNLSVRRATSVRDYLAGHGVDASRMSVAGKGESAPVASNDTEDGRAQNRRVELLVGD